jgi:heptosyltransferase-3
MIVDREQIRTIGVFKFRNIGDVLIITPALRALRETFPNAKISVAVNSVTDAMLAGNPHIDEVIVYDRVAKKKNVISRLLREAKLLKKLRARRFDMTIDFTSGDRPVLYSWVSGAKVRVSFANGRWKPNDWRRRAFTHLFDNPMETMHEVQRHLWLLKQIGVETKDDSLCLKTSAADDKWASELISCYRPKKVVHVHPVARWLFKCWDEKKMASVIDWLELEKGARVIITASPTPEEVEITESILKHCRSKPLFLKGKTTLGQVAALSKHADCFFGVDTAPMHMAAAVGAPVVCIFGPTNADLWRPWTKRQITIKKYCPCMPRRNERHCDWDVTRACLQASEPPEVQAALEKFL